jgi:hypothetical protein
MIEHAKGQGPLGIDYKILDAAEASTVLPPGSFDLATSCVALCDMPAPAAVLAGIRTLLPHIGVGSVTKPASRNGSALTGTSMRVRTITRGLVGVLISLRQAFIQPWRRG